MENDPDEEDMDDVNIDDERERHLRNVFEDNEGGVDDKKKMLWGVVNDNVVEEPTDHEEIGLRGFGFNVLCQYDEGVVREGSSEFPYLLMFIDLWTGDLMNQLKRMNMKLDEDNGKSSNKVNVQYLNFCRISNNRFWKNIGCLVSDPTFGLGGSSVWESQFYIFSKLSSNNEINNV